MMSIRFQPWRAASRRFATWASLVALWLWLGPASAPAGKVVLRIQAGNPIDKEQRVEIKSNLPAGVRTNDILSLGGLQLGYDVKSDQYYVHHDLQLGPRQIQVFDVEINDIWMVPEADLAGLRDHSRRMVDLLRKAPSHEVAQALQQTIEQNLERIQTVQRASAIGPGVTPLAHIRAHESNRETLKRVRIDVGRIENLVLATGQDPGGMLGDDKRSPKPERFLDAPADLTRTAVIRIVVENTSPNRKRTVPVRQDLPEEIREHDVVDAGGLDLGSDKARGVAYVYKQNLELNPLERRVFSVVIRDKWNLNGPRIEALKKTATELEARIAAKGKFVSIEKALADLIQALAAVAGETGPATVDGAYVAFYRDQAARLDDIENKINRIVMALPEIDRSTRLGFKVKPPSPKTTWMIIYIILGFLAVLSVVFYFRWYGRSRAEG